MDPLSPLTAIRSWLASKGVKAAPAKIANAVTKPADPLDEELIRLYTKGYSSSINDALAFNETQRAEQLADKLGIPFEEIVSRLSAMANQSSTANAPAFHGIMTPRYLDLLKRSDKTPYFISTSPDLKVADRYAGNGLAVFKRPGQAINPGKLHTFSDEPELILPAGRPLKQVDETEIRDKDFRLPVMLFEKEGGLVALKGKK